MSIAEKLALIAENEQKVYNAGYEKGKAEGGGGDEALKALIERTVTEIVIPEGTTIIGRSAFNGCDLITGTVNIPEGVWRIAQDAFNNCQSVTEINLPHSLTTIDGYAFSNMRALKKLILPSSITYLTTAIISESGIEEFVALGDITSVGVYVFSNCRKCLKYDFTACTSVPPLGGVSSFNNINPEAKILVPAALCDEWKVATNWATFADYIVGVGQSGSLDYLLNPDGTSYAVTGVGTYINTDGDGTKLVIPSEHNGLPVTVIETDAFGGAEDIVSVSIPETVTSIGAGAFADCSNITDIYFGANVGDLEAGVFKRAGQSGSGIKVVIGNKVTRIPNNLFYGGVDNENFSLSTFRPKITSVEFESGSVCTEIGQQAFYYCIELTSFVASPTLESIESAAIMTNGIVDPVLDFSACTQIPTLADTNLNASTIYVPAALYDEWKVATNWSSYASKIVAK